MQHGSIEIKDLPWKGRQKQIMFVKNSFLSFRCSNFGRCTLEYRYNGDIIVCLIESRWNSISELNFPLARGGEQQWDTDKAGPREGRSKLEIYDVASSRLLYMRIPLCAQIKIHLRNFLISRRRRRRRCIIMCTKYEQNHSWPPNLSSFKGSCMNVDRKTLSKFLSSEVRKGLCVLLLPFSHMHKKQKVELYPSLFFFWKAQNSCGKRKSGFKNLKITTLF